MKTIFNLYNVMSITNDKNKKYKNIFAINLNNFKYTATPINWILSEYNVYHFFDLIYDYYGSYDNYYEDMIILLNHLTNLECDDNIGKSIILPLKKDLDDFYQKYLNNSSED